MLRQKDGGRDETEPLARRHRCGRHFGTVRCIDKEYVGARPEDRLKVRRFFPNTRKIY